MAAQINGVFECGLQKTINDCKILVVGAGGIGCELLKNIVLTGFNNIEIIDLDTIDVSNLNRQFLFQKQHVGKSKANVSKESALRFAPSCNIVAHHDSIMKSEYGVSFFKKFAVCLNALDNRAARNHVNRMCLAANIPLVESGTAGYLGQVTVIKKGVTECYECQPKPHQKSFPGCTIRNTPSEPIHCIVWAKHLFNQLFGEEDSDQDVSPDTEDPEAAGDETGEAATAKDSNDAGNVERKSTRQWASDCDYNTQKLFQKFFNDDIKYLLSMDKLWAKRRKPTPLDWENLPGEKSEEKDDAGIKDQKVWSIAECAKVMDTSIKSLKELLSKLPTGDHLVWDKDDEPAMDFVTACANIRCHIFDIANKSRFEVKSMAGNIIPAIATTNAVIAGCIVMEAIKILNGQSDKCKTVYLRRQPNPRKKILVTEQLVAPNPKCYVCAEKPEISVKLNLETMTVKNLEEKVLKGALNMVAPDAEIEGKGVVLISSEEGETECNNEKFLKHFGLMDGAILKCDDFLQDYNITVILYHAEKLDEGVDFVIIGDPSQLKPKEETKNGDAGEGSSGDRKRRAEEENGGGESKKAKIDDDDDDIVICDDDEEEKEASGPKKAKAPVASMEFSKNVGLLKAPGLSGVDSITRTGRNSKASIREVQLKAPGQSGAANIDRKTKNKETITREVQLKAPGRKGVDINSKLGRHSKATTKRVELKAPVAATVTQLVTNIQPATRELQLKTTDRPGSVIITRSGRRSQPPKRYGTIAEPTPKHGNRT